MISEQPHKEFPFHSPYTFREVTEHHAQDTLQPEDVASIRLRQLQAARLQPLSPLHEVRADGKQQEAAV